MKLYMLAAAACACALGLAEPVDELDRTARPPAPVPLDLGTLDWKLPRKGASRDGDVVVLENTSETPDATVFASATVEPGTRKGRGRS